MHFSYAQYTTKTHLCSVINFRYKITLLKKNAFFSVQQGQRREITLK